MLQIGDRVIVVDEDVRIWNSKKSAKGQYGIVDWVGDISSRGMFVCVKLDSGDRTGAYFTHRFKKIGYRIPSHVW